MGASGHIPCFLCIGYLLICGFFSLGSWGSEEPQNPPDESALPLNDRLAQIQMLLEEQGRTLANMQNLARGKPSEPRAPMRPGLKRGLFASALSLGSARFAVRGTGWNRALHAFVCLSLGLVAYSYLKPYFSGKPRPSAKTRRVGGLEDDEVQEKEVDATETEPENKQEKEQ